VQSKVESVRWKEPYPPKKILIIRYQATGDLVITLPYVNSFKQHYPHVELHLLTREEVSSIPLSLNLFSKIMMLGGGRNTKLQVVLTLLKLPALLFQNYDIVMDLQNHTISRMVRKILRPKAWCAFDRYSALSAGERTQNTINEIGLLPVSLNTHFTQTIDDSRLSEKMKKAGWTGHHFVILNPAGAFITRNWPIENYARLAQLWMSSDTNIQFVITGLPSKVGLQLSYLKKILGERLVDLTNTNAAEAFALVRKADVLITEDSGLMHMAWVQRIPTLALFGSSRSDWSKPLGDWSVCLHSSDLPCGNCLLESCTFGDVHCLTRYSPEFVLEQSKKLISKK
jgi:ADP-heptose:LPS heptosyltransferase